MSPHHEVVGAIFLDIWGVANIALAMRGERVTIGNAFSFLLGAGLIALSHIA